jgi:hypothetical protein
MEFSCLLRINYKYSSILQKKLILKKAYTIQPISFGAHQAIGLKLLSDAILINRYFPT